MFFYDGVGMPVTIDECLFAHINNDPFLFGSAGLQGNRFVVTIGYLTQYLKELLEVPLEVQRLVEACQFLAEVESKIRGLVTERDAEKLAADMHIKISKLNAGESLLIPGGWSSTTTGGHAIIYQFEKDIEGNILFHINNSGSGLSHHKKKSTALKELYNPVLTYQIPVHKTGNQEAFSAILKQLIVIQKPSIHKRSEITADDLYLGIFQQFVHLDGVVVERDNKSHEYWYTGGQLSGTCSQRSLHQMLKSCFPSLDKYRQFIYGFKLKSLQDYLATFALPFTQQDLNRLPQIEKAIRHNLRLLNNISQENPEQFIFSEQRRADDLLFLSTKLGDIYKAYRELPPNSVLITQGITALKEEPYHALNLPNTVKPLPSTLTSLVPEATLKNPIVVSINNLDTQLQHILQHCSQISDKPELIMEQVERFLFALPVDADVDVQKVYSVCLGEDHAVQFLRNLSLLQKLYFKACSSILGAGYTLPNILLCKMIFIRLTGIVNELNPLHSNPKECFDKTFTSTDVMKNIATLPNSVYLANYDASLDLKVKAIQKYYKDNSEKYLTQTLLNYYDAILNEFPSLRTDLQKKYSFKYGLIYDPLHTKVRELQLGALFYFFTHKNELDNNFRPLQIKFELQELIEKNVLEYIKDFTTELKVTFAIQYDAFSRSLRSDGTYETKKYDCLDVTEKLKKATFPTKQAVFEKVFDIDGYRGFRYSINKRDDNHTQIYPHEYAMQSFSGSYDLAILESLAGRSIESSEIEQRELFHLRRHSATQILLSLDYFLEHLHHLKDGEYQQYLEANIFQPGLLCEQLNAHNSKLFFARFNELMSRGLKYFEDKGFLTQQSLYLLKLNYLVTQYAYNMDPENPLFIEGMASFKKELNKYLLINKNRGVKAGLHELRLLLLINQKQQTLSKEEQNELLLSHFFVVSFVNLNTQTSLSYQAKIKAGLLNSKRFFQTIHVDNTQLEKLLTELGLVIKSSWQIEEQNHPLYTVKDEQQIHQYSIDIAKGAIFDTEGKAYVALPLAIRTHPMIIQLGLGDILNGFISSDKKTYYLEKPPVKVRVVKGVGERYVIQKMFSDLAGEERYFERMAQTEHHQKLYKLDTFQCELSLSELLKQREVCLWKAVDKQEVVFTRMNEVYLRGAFKNHAYQLFKEDQAKLLPHLSFSESTVSEFEDKKFIACYLNTEKQQCLIELERYNLFLTGDMLTQNIGFNWQGDGYLLDKERHFAEGVPSLSFVKEGKELCLLPVQRYISTMFRRKQDEYYQLRLDTSNIVAADIMKKDTNLFWQHSLSQKYFVYTQKEGKPIPTTPAEALYLVYLYLGSNQPEKAWEALDYCDSRLGGLEGTFDELRFMQWLFKALPYKKEEELNANIQNPQFEACKLKALSLVTRLKQEGKNFKYPPTSQNLNTINERYQQVEINAVRSFEQSLNEILYITYSNYQLMHRDNDHSFLLNEDERKSLLEFYHDSLPVLDSKKPKALGALGAEWVSLKLNELLKESASLAVKPNLSLYEKQRLEEIKDYIEKHQGVAKKSSELVELALDTSIPPNARFNLQLLKAGRMYMRISEGKNHFYKSYSASFHPPLDLLLPGLSEETFLQNFSEYLHLAITPRANKEHRQQLKNFCYSTLVSARHIPLDNAESNLPLLCNILYRFLNEQRIEPYVIPNEDYLRTFSKLITEARKLPDPRITILQLKDTTHEVLLSSRDIYKQLESNYLSAKPIDYKSQTYQNIGLFIEDKHLENATKWRAIEVLSSAEEQTDNQGIKFLSAEELRLGASKYRVLMEQKREALQHFTDEKLVTLAQKVTEDSSLYANKINEMELDLLNLASRGSDEQNKKLHRDISIKAKQKSPLEINSLLQLFFQNDIEKYRLATGLNDINIDELHRLTAQYVYTKTALLQLSRVKKQIHIISESSIEDKAQQLLALGDLLYAENLVDPLRDPDLAVYQLHANLLIRPIQKEAIAHLLTVKENEGFTESIVRIIMGGGKSKVLLPTLAYKKATGRNLTILEVPQSLLRTNYVDLKSTSKQLFNQQAVLFEFNRQSDCSSKRLEQIHQQLTDVMVNRKYLVTTNDSIQSIELKFFELLHTPPKDSKALAEWEQQVAWSGKIVRLFRERGDAIIDEVHNGLLLKNKQNYTVGEDTPISQPTIKNCIELYKFLELVPLKFLPEQNLLDLLKNNKLFNHPEAERVFTQLAEELVNNPNTPLRECLATLSAIEKQEFTKYLLGTSLVVPEFILTLDEQIKDKIALYKQQVSHLLPHTLRRNHFEHYGPSKKTESTPALRALAIPYVANNKPNERSRFGNFIETMNYTIQSLLLSGVSFELFKNYIELLQTQARQELMELKLKEFKETPSAKQFNVLIKNDEFSLEQLNLEDEEQISKVHQLIVTNDAFTFEILEKHILDQIRLDAGILHSDAYNHVDILRSCQGMSGTPWNYQTFHQRLHFDHKSTEGLDAFVYQSFSDKKNAIIGYDFQDAAHAITSLFNQFADETPLRALIDINALFKGVSNKNIADEVAKYLVAPEHARKFRSPDPIKFILYFNEENKICALPLQGYPSVTPIVLGSSDVEVINERLGCNPEERFTIYDQDHTVGTDIKQGKKAKALVMVDNHTSLSHFFQGIMRMRGLIEGEQSVDVVVPTALQSKSKAQLCELMHLKERDGLKEDNFAAACAQLANVIRATATQHILSIRGDKAAQRQHELFKTFKTFFIEEQESNLFKLYGGISKKESTANVLANLKNNYLNAYKKIMSQFFNEASLDVVTVERKMDQIIQKACSEGMCEKEQMSLGTVLDNAVEVQKEVQVEVQTQKETQQQIHDPNLREATFVAWGGSFVLKIKTLEEVCQNPTAIGFTPNIKMTCNFYQSYQHQNQYLNKYMKPVHALLFQKINMKLECTLLSQQESEALANTNYFADKKDCWVSSTNHTPLFGTMPSEVIKDAEYQSIIEQVRFFNGEFSSLLSGDISLHWIKEKPKEKMAFFEQYLFQYRETLPRELDQLKAHLGNQMDKVYRYILSNLSLNGEQFDWNGQLQNMDKAQVKEAKEFALVANQLASEWEGLDLQKSDWYKDKFLSLRAKVFLQDSVDLIANLKDLITNFNKNTYSETLNKKIKDLCAVSSEFKRRWEASFRVGDKAKAIQGFIKERGLKLSDTVNFVRANDPNVDSKEFAELVLLAQNTPSILYGLIKNPTLFNTSKVFPSYINFKQSKDTVAALVKHKNFTKNQQLNLLKSARTSGVGADCVVVLLKQEELSLELSTALKDEHDPLVLTGIAEKIDDEKIMNKFLELCPDSLTLVPLSALIKPYLSDTLIQRILGTDLPRYQELIDTNEVLNSEVLRNKIIKCTTSKEELEYAVTALSSAAKIASTEISSIFNNPLVKQLNKQSVLFFAKNLNLENISVCIEKTDSDQDEMLRGLLENAHLRPEHLTQLIKKAKSSGVIKKATQHSNFKQAQLLELIEQPESKLQYLDYDFWIEALNKNMDGLLLSQFIERAFKSSIAGVLSYDLFLSSFPQAVEILASSKESSPFLLKQLVSRANKSTLFELIKHPNISEESARLILSNNKDAFIELLKNPQCTERQMKKIISSTDSARVLKALNYSYYKLSEDCFQALLEHSDSRLRESGIEDSAWCYWINQSTNINLLKRMSSRSFFSKDIQSLLDTRLDLALRSSLNKSVQKLSFNELLTPEETSELLQFWHKVYLTENLGRFLVNHPSTSFETLQEVASKTSSDETLYKITDHPQWKNELAQVINKNPYVSVRTLRRVHQLNPKVVSQDQIVSLMSNQQLTELDAVKGFESVFELNVMRELLNKIESSIKLALGQKITSNRNILFKTGTKDEKDEKITRNLHSLNLSLAKDETKDTILENFSNLCATACKRRNKLVAISSKYSTDTHSARYLIKEFLSNTPLLTHLGIPASLDEKKKKVLLQKKMMEACRQPQAVQNAPK